MRNGRAGFYIQIRFFAQEHWILATDNQPSDDDGELVVRAQHGDADAYDRLMLRYQDAIARQMRRYSQDLTVIEDLTQTVFVNAYQGLGNYRPEAPFAHWLRTIATNVGYDHWRREARRSKFVSYHEHEELLADPAPEDDDSTERFDKLVGLMQKLKPPERQILFLLYVDGASIETAAKTMGWNQAATKMRAYRARNKLRSILRKHNAEGEVRHDG